MTKLTKHQAHERLLVFAFLLTVVIALGAFYYIYQTASYGQTVKGVQDLAAIWEKRKAMQAEQAASIDTKLLSIRADNGCCNYLESPSKGSQLKIDVKPSTQLCYMDSLTQEMVSKHDFRVVDIEAKGCPKTIRT